MAGFMGLFLSIRVGFELGDWEFGQNNNIIKCKLKGRLNKNAGTVHLTTLL